LAQTTPLFEEDEQEADPADIDSGTCDQLRDVVFPLAGVASPTGEEMGTAGAHPVKISTENHVDVPLQEILDGGHAINVHLSADEIGIYIACGDIGGVVHERENGEGMEVDIALDELNGSGHVGTARLGDDGEGGTNVHVLLIEPGAMSSGGGTAEAAPVQELPAPRNRLGRTGRGVRHGRSCTARVEPDAGEV
jgi:hypothetical protein